MWKSVLPELAGSLGLFLFRLGLFFEFFRPCRILNAADPGDESDQASKKENGRDKSENQFIEGSPPNDNQPNSKNHSDQAGDYCQVLTHVDTSSYFSADYNRSLFQKKHFF